MDEFNQFPYKILEKKSGKKDKRDHTLTFAAGACIFAHNKILLNRSDSTDLWTIPGSTIPFHESAEETVIRSLKEEMNLNIVVLKNKPFLFNFQIETDDSYDNIFLLHFLVRVEGKAKIQMGKDVTDYKWENITHHFRDAYPNVQPAIDHFIGI